MSAKCIQEILGKAVKMGLDLTEREVGEMFRKIRETSLRFEKEQANPNPALHGENLRQKLKTLSPENRVREYAKIAFEQTVADKQEALRRQYVQVQRNAEIEGRIRTTTEKTHTKALNEITFGVEYRRNAIADIHSADLAEALDRYHTKMGYKFTPEDRLDFYREALNPGSTKNANAAALSRDWLKTMDDMRERANAAGADIKSRKDWAAPQAWVDGHEMKKRALDAGDRARLLNPLLNHADRLALHLKSKEAWVNDAFTRVDRRKYWDEGTGEFLNDTQMKEVLSRAWETITTDGMNERPEAQQGNGGLAKRMGASRELHFKDAEGLDFMMDKYGQGDLMKALLGTIRKRAHQTALLETFGPNPDMGFRSGLDLAKHLDAGDMTLVDKIRDKSAWSQLYYDELRGVNNQPSNSLAVRAMDGLRNWLTASKLGSALLSHPSHLATFTTLARTDGLGMGDGLRIIAKALNPLNEADRALARRHGILAQAAINDIALNFSELSSTAKASRAAANLTIKLGGMEWWINSMKRSFQTLIATHLSDAVKTGDMGALDPHFKAMLDRYGINEKDWNVIRQAKPVEIYGEPSVTPTAIRALGNTPEIREAAIKVGMMMSAEADIATVTPGVKEHAFMKGGTMPNSIAGQFTKSIFLFRTFSTTMMTKVLPRVINTPGGKIFAASLAAQFAIGMTILGGVSVQLKEMSKGRNPRDIFSPEFWAAAFAQGNGLGILGDFVFGERNRFGGSAGATLAGPVAGFGEDVTRLTKDELIKAMKGKDSKLAAESVQFAKNYAPFGNLWYTRAAIDHLLFFKLQEAANPGYLRRMKSRVEKENDTTFWWKPTDTLPSAPDMSMAVGRSR